MVGCSSLNRSVFLHNTNIQSKGKQWHATKTPFRKNAGLTSFAKRAEERKARDAIKAKEKEMKDEKEAERQVGVHRENREEEDCMLTDNSVALKPFALSARQRPKRNATPLWRRRCTKSVWSVSRGGRSATRCLSPE